MSQKFMTDKLHSKICSDLAKAPEGVSVMKVLEWFDKNPGWVPGRTSTVSEFYEAYHIHHRADGDAMYLGLLRQLGYEVVPDAKESFPLPTENGTRFIAYSSKQNDSREFVVASPFIVDLNNGSMYSRDAFNSEWVVTSIAKKD